MALFYFKLFIFFIVEEKKFRNLKNLLKNNKKLSEAKKKRGRGQKANADRRKHEVSER